MRSNLFLCVLPVIAGVLILAGCGSSEESTSKDQATAPAQGTVQKAAEKADTLGAAARETPKPLYDPHSSIPAMAGKFSVQVGAYSLVENANRVATLAKDRFGKNVYTIPDPQAGLVKVYVGDFASKDEARRFRDEMAQKYPLEYKDAWVSENPSK